MVNENKPQPIVKNFVVSQDGVFYRKSSIHSCQISSGENRHEILIGSDGQIYSFGIYTEYEEAVAELDLLLFSLHC